MTIAKMLTDLMGGELMVESEPEKGAQFRVRIFLPHLVSDHDDQVQVMAQCVGYVGMRRRIMIVDNEKSDRDLLTSMLEPLGFHLAQASSGQECIDLIPEFRPHLIFMDLSMPGIDGWETIRRIRLSDMTGCEIAVISANAFEKNAYNDVGITTENFITKPVRLDELLDWIGRHLQLEWVKIGMAPPEPSLTRYPPSDRLLSLGQQIELGYLRGILKELDLIEQIDSAYMEFVENMRHLARQFQFATMTEILREGVEGGRHEDA